MAKYLTAEGREFRELVVALEGNLAAVATVLGISRSAVSHRLNTELHGAWWRSFKKRRAKERRAARARRARARARERAREAWAWSAAWAAGEGP